MKATEQDLELADRFPNEPTIYGLGKSMSDAKISPKQLERLIKLDLIKIATNNYCGGQLNDTPGKGTFLRQVTTFLRKK